MPSEMQERIAAELMNTEREINGLPARLLEHATHGGRAHYMTLAFAAMRALREPTPIMTEAGWNAHGEVDARYTAMLDAEIAAAER